MVFSTKPDSLSVSEWMATCVSVPSATSRQLLMAEGGAPVFVQLEADGAGVDLLVQRVGQAGVALAEKAQVHGEGVRACSMRSMPRGPGRAGGGQRAGGGAGAAAQHGGHAAGHGALRPAAGR